MSTQDKNGGKDWSDDPRLTAYALGELGDGDRAQLEAEIEDDDAALGVIAELRAMAATLEGHFAAEQAPELSVEQRAVIEERMTGATPRLLVRTPWTSLRKYQTVAAAALITGYLGWAISQLSEEPKYGIDSLGGARMSVKSEQDRTQTSGLDAVGYLDGRGTNESEPLGALAGLAYLDGPSTSEVVSATRGGTYRGPGDTGPTVTGNSDWFLGRGEGAGAVPRGPGNVRRVQADGRVNPDENESGVRSTGTKTQAEPSNREAYDHLPENEFKLAQTDPYSTFSIDVDTASYANSRRMIEDGQLPPPDAIRIEEFVNYFPYDYPAPDGEHPFSVNVEVGGAPWAPQHRLVRVGLKGQETLAADRKASNLVFLMDVSGSMNSPDKLPLLKKALHMLVQELDERDTVSIVVYAGASGLALEPTNCDYSVNIHMALEGLSAGGSTNGGAGIELAYRLAAENFIEGGINRVILATDGDFNVGVSSDGDLVRLIEKKAKTGVFLSVLGFGRGNLQDSKMEQLANKGNGNYAYIDSEMEARKVLVEEMGSTLETIAKDVKIQVEFNPAEVQAYRLIGYENRILATQDFNDDKKDAGEIGAGHNVTALYEIVPVGVELDVPGIDPLRYQEPKNLTGDAFTGELMLLKLRYKQPDEDESTLLTTPVMDKGATFDELGDETRFAATVAAFGMILRGSKYKGSATLEDVSRWAIQSAVNDPGGYRAQFIGLVGKARSL
jgi:Ca-activated chloride channel family protein